MSVRPTRNVTRAALATIVVLAANACEASAAGRPDGASLSIEAPNVALADRCDLHSTIASVRVLVHNRGDAPSPAIAFTVRDSAHALAGKAALPALNAREARTIDVEMKLDDGTGPDPARGPNSIAGAHVFVVYASHPGEVRERITSSVAQISTTIPAAFCGPAIARAAPTASPAIATAAAQPNAALLFRPSAPRSFAVVAPPVVAQTNGPFAATATRVVPFATQTPRFSPGAKPISMKLALGVPEGLRATSTVGDCVAHTFAGFAAAVTCQQMIAGGNLMLVWDPPSDPSATGYRVYALVGAERGPVVATEDKRAQTIAILPPLVSGASPRCYVVTATDGSNESLAGKAYCSQAAQKTQTLGTSYTRPTWKDHSYHGGVGPSYSAQDPVTDGPVVGYFSLKANTTFGQNSYNTIHRYGVAFDVDALGGKRRVSAHLHLTIQSSYGAGNNHSCATTVAGGTEFWWKKDAQSWIDGTFDGTVAHFNATGPVVTADVTSLVAAVVAGSPNYGFVIRNDNEDLGAYDDAQCETVYSNPQLDIVYYDR